MVEQLAPEGGSQLGVHTKDTDMAAWLMWRSSTRSPSTDCKIVPLSLSPFPVNGSTTASMFHVAAGVGFD
jgi:hypothetical protein